MRSRSKVWAWVRRIGAGLAIVGLIGLIASFPVAGSYETKAVKVQRVEVDKAGAALFGDGDAFRNVGSPQLLIIEDPKAFVANAPDGTKRIDDGYMRAHGLYPLQLQTVHFAAGLARIALGAVLMVGLSALLVGRRSSTVPTR